MEEKIAFVVLSCDPYSDIWEAYGQMHHKFWGDCPFDLYLASHHKEFNEYGFKSLLIGEDISWSDGLITTIKMLKNIGYKYAFLAFDDLMLTKQVDTAYVQAACHKFIEESGDCLRFVPAKASRPSKYNQYYGKLPLKIPYRVTLGFALWKLDTLEKIAVKGESAWQFEKNASQRSFCFDRFFCSTKSPFKFLNLIIKRKLEVLEYRKLKKFLPGIKIEREQMLVVKERVVWPFLWIFLHWLPASLQYYIYQKISKPINI